MNPLKYVRTANIGEIAKFELEAEAAQPNVIDVNKLPGGLVIGNTLLDVSSVPSAEVRAGISLSMLFANRVAPHDPGAKDVDSWLAAYQTSLGDLGFRLSGTARVNSHFHKLNVDVHKAIIPFLTIAFGGGAIGPIILSALDNLQKMKEDSPWITLFDRETRRFSVQEMHFGAAVANGTETEIRYAVARLHVDLGQTQILFFRVTKNTADFESLTTRMSVSNSLMAVMEDDLKTRLSALIKRYIWNANIG